MMAPQNAAKLKTSITSKLSAVSKSVSALKTKENLASAEVRGVIADIFAKLQEVVGFLNKEYANKYPRRDVINAAKTFRIIGGGMSVDGETISTTYAINTIIGILEGVRFIALQMADVNALQAILQGMEEVKSVIRCYNTTPKTRPDTEGSYFEY